MEYETDWGLRIRMALALAGLGILYAAFVGALIAWLGRSSLPLVVLGGVAFVGLQYRYSDEIALRAVDATRVEDGEYADVRARLERLARTADLPPPDLAVIDSEVPNALATGQSPGSATVCVTTGLVETLEDRELDAVLAHELAHVRNRDAALLTVVAGLATAASLVVRRFWWFGDGADGGDGGGGDSGTPWFLVFVAVSLVTWIGSYLLIRALSRHREYAADRGAAAITGDPAALASALTTIEDDVGGTPEADLRSGVGANALYVVPYDGIDAAELLRTHPPTGRRVERLRELSRDLSTS